MVFKLYGFPRISAALGRRRLVIFLSQMRRLFEGGPYSGAALGNFLYEMRRFFFI